MLIYKNGSNLSTFYTEASSITVMLLFGPLDGNLRLKFENEGTSLSLSLLGLVACPKRYKDGLFIPMLVFMSFFLSCLCYFLDSQIYEKVNVFEFLSIFSILGIGSKQEKMSKSWKSKFRSSKSGGR